MPVDAAQIAPPERHAVAVEEIENLDGDLAAAADLIAELRGGERTVWLGTCDLHRHGEHFAQRFAQEKMIVRHFVDTSEPCRKLEQPANIAFGAAERSRNIARARRANRNQSSGRAAIRRSRCQIAAKALPFCSASRIIGSCKEGS